jgi:glyoxylase-like metal-dependent hydrolase (beta-lactamase superfamily II)
MAAVDPAYTVDAEPLAAGTLAAGGLSIRVLPTPGHTSDSVSFLVTSTAAGSPIDAAVLTGDTVLGAGTTVVAHPDGVLADYLRSLDVLGALTGARLLPGHGPVRAVAAGAVTAEDVVTLVYADVDPGVRDAAVLSVRAQLAYLEGSR